MPQKKKPKQNIKQKQKQHQKQTVIVNVMTSKSRRGTKRAAPKNRQSSPLIQTLPLQYTPYTMYDNSRLFTEEGRNRNQIFAPEIPNAIPMAEVAQEPELLPAPTTPAPISNTYNTIDTQTDAEQDDTFNADENTDYDLEPEPTETEWDIKTRGVMNATYPTQAALWKKAQRKNLMPTPVDNSIDRLISDGATDADYQYSMGDLYNILSPSDEGEKINPLKSPASYRKTKTTNIDENEDNLKTDKSGGGGDDFRITDQGRRYYCNLCGYDIQNTTASIKSHKGSQTHKRNVGKQMINDNEDEL